MQLKTIFHYLTLDQHRHVHEHVVEFSNRVLQLDDVGVSSFDVGKCLFCLLCLHDDLLGGKIEVRMSLGFGKKGVAHYLQVRSSFLDEGLPPNQIKLFWLDFDLQLQIDLNFEQEIVDFLKFKVTFLF